MTENTLLDKVLKDLFDQAFSDGVVTDDEFEIIQQVEIGIDEYNAALHKAREDGIITDVEHQQLEHIKDKVLQSAREVANLDGIIDHEEHNLLSVLSEIIRKYLG